MNNKNISQNQGYILPIYNFKNQQCYKTILLHSQSLSSLPPDIGLDLVYKKKSIYIDLFFIPFYANWELYSALYIQHLN